MQDDGEWDEPVYSSLTGAIMWLMFGSIVGSVLGLAVYWSYWMVLYVTGEIK
jgi:hypothetical protein